MDVKRQIQEYWDWRSSSYINGVTGLVDEERDIWKRYLSSCLGTQRLKVLDVGTGRGFLALLLAELGHEVTAVDISQSMLDEAEKEAGSRGLDVKFMKCDAENLPFHDETFDIVVNKYLLWTLPEPDKALSEWNRVLSSENGKVIAIDGNWFDPAPSKKLKRWLTRVIRSFGVTDRKNSNKSTDKFSQHYSQFSHDLPLYLDVKPDSVKLLFERTGFSQIDITDIPEIQKYNLSKLHPLLRLLNTDSVFVVIANRKA